MIGRFRIWLANPENIGPPECPIILRWTLLEVFGCKLLVHRFTPRADDRDVHDHPSPFATLCVAGGYDDLVPCPADGCSNGYLLGGWMGGTKARPFPDLCPFCTRGLVVGDRVRRGSFRYRPATHAHRTRAGTGGAWTIVAMGRKVRPWGFWREGQWWPWKTYREQYGYAHQCP